MRTGFYLGPRQEFAKLPQAEGWHPILDSSDRKVQMRRHSHYNKDKDLHERHLRHFLAQVTLAGWKYIRHIRALISLYLG